MFFQKRLDKQAALNKMANLLAPYLYLDENKKDGKGGEMRFKFSNNGLGVEKETIDFLDDVCNELDTWQLSSQETLTVIDTLVLYSNHLEMNRSNDSNEDTKVAKEQKVLHWLQKASERKGLLDLNDPRHMSTWAQLCHYLFKAMRTDNNYAGNTYTIETRYPFLQESVALASALQDKQFLKDQDPHQFPDRLLSYGLPEIYELRRMKSYSEAITKIEKYLSLTSDSFMLVQLYTQKAHALREDGQALEGKAFAMQALELSIKEVPNLKFNALQALMLCHFDLEEFEEAAKISKELLDEKSNNPKANIRKDVLDDAERIIFECERACPLRY